MRILLTGASGFVGSHIKARLPCVPLELDGEEADIRDGLRVPRAVAGCPADAAIHLAAQSSVPASFNDPRATFDVNLFGTLNMLQVLDAAKFRALARGTSRPVGVSCCMWDRVKSMEPFPKIACRSRKT